MRDAKERGALESLSKRQLIDNIIRLEERLAALERRNLELETELARARKDSSNSSKPPSSDIVKPPRDARPKGSRRQERKFPRKISPRRFLMGIAACAS